MSQGDARQLDVIPPAAGGAREKGRDRSVDLTVLRDRLPADERAAPIAQLMRRYAQSLYLDVGNVCNMACTYCCVPRPAAYVSSLGNLEVTIDAAADAGVTKVVLIGGEPTIYKGLFPLLEHIRARGFEEVILTTNGLMLGYDGFVTRLREHGVTMVHLSLDDFDPEVMVSLTRHPRAPEVLHAALEHLTSVPSLSMYLYAVVCRQNLDHLDAYVREVARLADRRGTPMTIVFAGMKPLERAADNREVIMPSLSEAANAVRSAHEVGLELGVTVGFKHIPPCLLPGLEAWNLDAYATDARMDLTSGRLYPPERDASDEKGVVCEGCPWDESCHGVHRDYLVSAGWDEFGHGAA